MRVFISGVRPDIDRTVNLQADLDTLGYSYFRAEGVYKGEREASYEVLTTADELVSLLNLAGKYNQECILVADEDTGEASLVTPAGLTTPVGRLVSVSEEEAVGRDHTYIPAYGKYYVVVSRA